MYSTGTRSGQALVMRLRSGLCRIGMLFGRPSSTACFSVCCWVSLRSSQHASTRFSSDCQPAWRRATVSELARKKSGKIVSSRQSVQHPRYDEKGLCVKALKLDPSPCPCNQVMSFDHTDKASVLISLRLEAAQEHLGKLLQAQHGVVME